MMTSRLYWIASDQTSNLAIMPRPHPGDALRHEIKSFRKHKVDIVVSLLDKKEVNFLGLEKERELCEAAGIEFISFPIPDRGIPPSPAETAPFIEKLFALVAKKKVAIHCRVGIGRASTIAAAILLHFGYDPAMALTLISESRGLDVPDTEAQKLWLNAYHTFLETS